MRGGNRIPSTGLLISIGVHDAIFITPFAKLQGRHSLPGLLHNIVPLLAGFGRKNGTAMNIRLPGLYL
jgi:hypothetical protein